MPNLMLHVRRLPFALLPILCLGPLTIPVTARTVTVDCNFNTISNALKTLDTETSNTVRVFGTCHDSIAINDFASLSIVGMSSGDKNAGVESLSGKPVFVIAGSHVQIKNLTITGGTSGVICQEFSICRFSGNTIQNGTSSGVYIDRSDASFSGDVIQNNANFGLNFAASRVRVNHVTVKGTTVGTGPGNGVEVDSGSTLAVEQLTVHDNQGAGISLIGNSNLNNRSLPGAFTVNNNGVGGIWVTEQSSADLGGATVINNTGGAGVVITGNSEASFWGGGTFTGNQFLDVYCGDLNGVAAAPQQATIGVTNCPNTY